MALLDEFFNRLKKRRAISPVQDDPLTQGLKELPRSVREVTRQTPEALRIMLKNPREFSRQARTARDAAPEETRKFIPKFVSNFSAQQGQIVGTGIKRTREGIEDIKRGQTTRGAFKTVTGTAGAVSSIFPAQVTASLASAPDKPIDKNDLIRRFSSGFLSSSTGAGEVTTVPSKKTKLGPFEFDPVKTGGGVIGFVRHPFNRSLFKLTESVFPAGQLARQKLLSKNNVP